MRRTESGSPNRSRSRSYRAAPPLLHRTDIAEGGEILDELVGPTGVLVRAALRDVMLWIEEPAATRPALFSTGAGARRNEQIRAAHAELDPELWTALLTLAALTEQPFDPDLPRLVYACRRIADWAEEHGKPATRLAFVQASALLSPQEADRALEVARQARDAGQFARAESWFRHAIPLARGRDWESYVWAFVGLAVLYMRTGDLRAAEALFDRAMRSARRRKIRAAEGVVHHHLFHLSAEAGRFTEAYQHVREALGAYGRTHDRLPALVHDVGRFWVLVGRYARAVPLFQATLEHFASPNEQALAAANLTHAAAGASDRAAYECARRTALDTVRRAAGPSRVAEVYLHVAYGDRLAGESSRADSAARRALALAEANHEAEVRLAAESLVADASASSVIASTAAPAEPLGVERQAERLAGDLVRALVAPGAEPHG